MTPRKHYFGNYPNSVDYDANVPIGFNRWDAEEYEYENEDLEPDDTDLDDKSEENTPVDE